MSRRIEISAGGEEVKYIGISFDTYGVLLYFVYTLNNDMAFLLYKSMISEYDYRISYDLPLGNITNTNLEAYISINDLPLLFNYIETNIIPALQALPESLNIIELWNVNTNLEVFLENTGGFFSTFNIDNEENIFEVGDILDRFIQLSEFFQHAYATSIMYTVSIM